LQPSAGVKSASRYDALPDGRIAPLNLVRADMEYEVAEAIEKWRTLVDLDRLKNRRDVTDEYRGAGV